MSNSNEASSETLTTMNLLERENIKMKIRERANCVSGGKPCCQGRNSLIGSACKRNACIMYNRLLEERERARSNSFP